MRQWIPYAFVRILVFFIAGILCGLYLPDVIAPHLAILIFILLLLAYVVSFIAFKIFRKRFFNAGFIGLGAIFMAGLVNLFIHTDVLNPDHLLHVGDSVNYYHVVVSDYPQEKTRSWKIEAEVKAVAVKGTWQKASGKILLYFPKASFEHPYQYGDKLLIQGSPQTIKRPSNPNEFDYQKFLAFQHIYHQQFVSSQHVVYIENSPESFIIQKTIQARHWAYQTIRKYVEGEREQGMAAALVLGVKEGLDNELLQAYSSTGAMHVLAVSGLHVGIIYLILSWIFRPLSKSAQGRVMTAVLSVLILWTYAFITGLSPSVLRAVTMFTFFVVGKSFQWKANIYNTMAASAFILLLVDPFFLMSVGFQLSYLAILGIVYLQPVLYRLWEPEGRLADEIWKITSVAVAAQVATFALGMLYFHQFPNYFFLSNIAVIPGSFMILIGGIILLVTSVVPAVASLIGFLIGWVIKVLNYIVFVLESLPFSVTEGIYINTFQCGLIMVMIISSILFVQYKKALYLYAASIAVVVFSAMQWIDYARSVNHKRLTVYNIQNHAAFDLIHQGKAFFLADSVLAAEESKIRFHIRPNRIRCKVSQVRSAQRELFSKNFSGGRLIVWNRKTILHIDQKDFRIGQNLAVDYLIVSHNAIKDYSNILKYIQVRNEIILDSSNSLFYVDSFLRKVSAINSKVYSVLHEGAYNKELI